MNGFVPYIWQASEQVSDPSVAAAVGEGALIKALKWRRGRLRVWCLVEFGFLQRRERVVFQVKWGDYLRCGIPLLSFVAYFLL